MTTATLDPMPKSGAAGLTQSQIALGIFLVAIAFALARSILPDGLFRFNLWEAQTLADGADAIFSFVQNDMGLMTFTRFLTGGLEFILDASGNILYGKRRPPNVGPVPWTAIAATTAVLGYWLGGWRMALLGGGAFVWAALVGQWKITMESMSVIIVAAPMAFLIGLLLGIAAWKYDWFDRIIKPVLAVLQTLPFLTYLLPAVIFFKVGPTAASVATIVYALPPMILMTTLGLRKVPHEVVEAGHMSGCTRWQMLRNVYIPSARTEILIGVNQIFMLCLAMIVLTAFIGMPGLGAKLLAMMNSFKLGRSFEIGITIVLIAVMLDRLSRAWVEKQPQHFPRGTPWWKRHLFLLLGLAVFIFFTVLGNYVEWFSEIGRRDHYSQGKNIDGAIRDFLDIDSVQGTTDAIRTFLIVQVLIPFRDWMLSLPMPTVVLTFAAIAYYVSGLRSALLAGGFFVLVAMGGWWDRAMITLYTVIWSVTLTAMIGLPIAIWGAVGKYQPMTMRTPPLELAIGVVGLFLKRLPIIILAACIVSVGHYIAVGNKLTTYAWEDTETKVVLIALFFAIFFLLYLWARKMKRDKVLLVILDTMQTFPSFVYLIPAIMLFGINDVSVIFSIMIYTFVPLMRYTIEGLRNVPPELTEAADMSGATAWQKLRHVQLPMALPTMAIGFNQAIMFAFFMVIIAAFIGTQDIGQELQRTLAGTELGKNFILGISVSLMALVFDHITTRWSQKRREALGLA